MPFPPRLSGGALYVCWSRFRHFSHLDSCTVGPRSGAIVMAWRDPDETSRRSRTTLLAFAAAALWMFLYEATKQALLPGLSPWQSHGITIFVSACTAAAVTYASIVSQSRTLRRLAQETARIQHLEVRQAALAHSEARYRLLVEASPEAIAVHRHGRLLYVNAAAASMIGAEDGAQLINLPIRDFIAATETQVGPRMHGDTERVEYRLLRSDGAMIEVEAASVQILYEEEDAIQTVLRDVTQRKHLEARLVHDAFHDPLTGLPNRALFRDRLGHALTRLVRTGARTGTTVLFLDLDDFKAVNDTLGHAAGDRLLAIVASRLQSVTRSHDTVARLGGDEFAILLEELAGPLEALEIVARVTAAFATPVRIDEHEMVISASIGIAHAAPADDPDLLLRNADVAMYEAKDRGKSRQATYAPHMHEAIMQRRVLETELRAAAHDPAAAGFSLSYQPIMDIDGGAIRAMEALIRWHHPVRGLTPPDQFIPLAEQSGVIVPIGTWILEEACRQLEMWRVQWLASGRPAATLPSVTINISGRQLQEDSFIDTVTRALRLTSAPARNVTLEITETVIMQRTERTLATLQSLKALGVRLAIDDFGTGYSSLSYLQRFPVDVLKIDRAFVEGVAEGGSGTALARTIIALGATLGLQTVAEGVEDESQRMQLQAIGCQFGQGYHFARPMPAIEATRWLLTAPVRATHKLEAA